ncbi:MAG: MipA/OmpV family protein [Gammaproteobacteria bacterium]|nr:MipA/OmpV family protein [Gammaproteobacteria bacterium]MDH3507738.1 MipA/OmpV family protein [Gammaproteobacteria bacterium]
MHLYSTPTPAARHALIVALAALMGQPAFAQSQTLSQAPEAAGEEERPSLWEFRLAAFGQHAPAYPGSTEPNVTLLPIPIPVYRGSFLNFGENLDQVARGEIAETRRLRLGVDLNFTFGEDSSEIAVRQGMPDLDFMLEIGPELEIKLNDRTPEQGELLLALQLRAGVSFDGVDPSSQGFLLNPELEYRRDQVFGGDNLLSLRWKPTWASEDFMDYYYEVDPLFATAERAAYDASSGYLGSKFTAALTRQINERLVFGISASYFLNSGAQNELSPLFLDDSGASIQAAFIWTLWESERRSRRRPSRR